MRIQASSHLQLKTIYIESCTFLGQVIFYNCSLNGDFHMGDCNFLAYVNFIYTNFKGKAYFANLVFVDDVDFTESNFYKESTIWLSIFCKSLIFDNATFHQNSIISEINFLEINLNNMKSLQLGLLKLSGIKNSSLIENYFKKIVLN